MEYARIVDVSLCHEYYNGSSCGFKVVPSAETAEILKKEEALCRIYDGKVRLMAPATSFAQEVTLLFYVKASIAEVWNVTNFDGIAHDEFPVAIVSCDGGVRFEGRSKDSLPELQKAFQTGQESWAFTLGMPDLYTGRKRILPLPENSGRSPDEDHCGAVRLE